MSRNPSMQELVSIDLIHRARSGTGPVFYTGNPEALLDAYESALDQCCYLRQVIEEMTIGEHRYPTFVPARVLEPHHAAARLHAEDECGKLCEHPRHEPGA